MKKLFAVVLTFALAAAFLTACRGNVSDHKGGKITDPTIVTEPMMTDPTVTMPSTDTAPVATQPPTTHATTPSTEHSTVPSPGMDEASKAVPNMR